jgi:hypothetical protein|tara:strand:+ start:1451 stop:1603 length:153 start_codon:yes stop_codon:yes gene_type:complete
MDGEDGEDGEDGVKGMQAMVLMSYIASNFTDQAITEMNSRTPQGYACVEF